MSSFTLSVLERKKEEINRIAVNVAFLYLSDIRLRSGFISSKINWQTITLVNSS